MHFLFDANHHQCICILWQVIGVYQNPYAYFINSTLCETSSRKAVPAPKGEHCTCVHKHVQCPILAVPTWRAAYYLKWTAPSNVIIKICLQRTFDLYFKLFGIHNMIACSLPWWVMQMSGLVSLQITLLWAIMNLQTNSWSTLQSNVY